MYHLVKLMCLFLLPVIFYTRLSAQNAQTINANSVTAPIIFSGSQCIYKWVNNTPAIGLAARGTGNIPSFTALNPGSTPVTATINAYPASPGFEYVVNSGDNTVSVINTATYTLVATIPVGFFPYGVSVSPNGEKVYVVNAGDNSVSVIDAASNTVTATISVGISPIGALVSPDNNKVYIADESSSNIAVIDAQTNK